METTELLEQIFNLVEVIRDEAASNAVSFSLFVNSEGHKFEFDIRTAGDLKASGVSMRNLGGEFIK